MKKLSTIKNLSTIPVSILNSSYLGKEMIYNGEGHSLRQYKGNIIYIAYYKDLDGPYCEVKLNIWNGKTINKIMPLSEVILVTQKKSKKSAAA